MKDIKDLLLYLQCFHDNNIIDLEHNDKLHLVSEVLGSVINRRIVEYKLNFCEDSILDLIDLSSNNWYGCFEKTWYFQRNKKIVWLCVTIWKWLWCWLILKFVHREWLKWFVITI